MTVLLALLLVSVTVLGLAVLVGFGAIPGARSRGVRVLTAVAMVLAAIVLAVSAVVAALAAAPPGARAPGATHGTHDTHGTHATGPAAGGDTRLSAELAPLPDGFTYLRETAPSVQVELRYASTNNFTGRIVPGYESTDAAILRTDSAKALALVQQDVEAQGYSLRVYDAFRPTRAVQFFMDWAQTSDDSTKAEYYPDFAKPQLFAQGYIAEQSGHSLGGTVDLTLVDLATGQPLDMGGPFDFFGERSHYEAAGLTPEQAAHRKLLHDAMAQRGFAQYPLEWWHYTHEVPVGAAAADFVVR